MRAAPDRLRIQGGGLSGEVIVPGDKSISHRALLVGALASGTTRLTGFLEGEDCRATLAALRALGVAVEADGAGSVTVHGRGNQPFKDPVLPLDLSNAGTALRLLAGVLAGRGTRAILTGDASLRERPMARVVEPLKRMGAHIEARDGHPPLSLSGGALTGCRHRLPIASAQVKSALLFAGLHAEGETWVEEPLPSRDHTERMLLAFGMPLVRTGGALGVQRCDFDQIAGHALTIPGDPSAAAFPIVGALLTPGASLRVKGVGLNPTRTGFLAVLERMGAVIERCVVADDDTIEPHGELLVHGGRLQGVRIGPEEIPGVIDEIPALLAAAACAEGRTVVEGADELRVKESDRISAMADGLAALGIRVNERPDGIEVFGERPRGGEVDARHDHRIAMAFAMLGTRASGPVIVRNTAEIATSYPGFIETMRTLGLEVDAA